MNYIIQTIFRTVTGNAASAAAGLGREYGKVGGAANVASAATGRMGASSASAAGVARAAVGDLPPAYGRATLAAERHAMSASGGMDRVSNRIGGVVSRLAAMAAAYIGIHQAVGMLTTGIREQMSMEDSVLAMSSIIQANFTGLGSTAGEQFASAMEMSNQYMTDLANRAGSLPGTFDQFRNISMALAGQMFATGETPAGLLEKTASTALFAKQVPGARPEDVGNQMARMLRGESGSDNPIAMAMKANNMLSVSFEELNKMSASERTKLVFDAINARVSSAEFLAGLEKSASVQFSTLKDNVFGITGALGMMSRKLMPYLVSAAVDLNRWFGENRDTVRRIGEAIGDYLGSKIEDVKDGVKWIRDHMDEIRTGAIGVGAVMAGWKVGSMATGAMSMAGSPTVGALAAGGIAGAGVVLAGLVMKMVGFAQVLAVVTGLGGVAAGAGAALVGLWGAITLVAGPIAAIAVPIAAVAGAMWAVADSGSFLGIWFRTSTGRLGESLMRLAATLGGAFQGLAMAIGPVLVPLIIGAADALAFMVNMILDVVNVAGGMVAYISALFGAIAAGEWRSATTEAARAWDEFKFEDVGTKFADAMGKDRSVSVFGSGDKDAPKDGRPGVTPRGGDQIIQGDIHLNLNLETDVSPDRIAFETLEEMKKLQWRESRRRPWQPV